MAAKCKKCDPHELCEECPEWIFTLADLIMCMMGLFVILWCLKTEGAPAKAESKISEDDVKVFASIREAFSHEPDPDSTDPIDIEMLKRKLEKLRPHMGPGEGGETKLKPDGAVGTDPEVTKIREGKKVGIGGRLLFSAGDAELSPETKRNLDQIADKIRGHRQIVLVKGHTSLDDLGEDAAPQQQMDLSYRRAEAVMNYLVGLKVSPEILRVQGCSIHEPVKQRAYTEGALTFNRRVEVEVTDDIVEERQDRSQAPAVDHETPASEHAAAHE